MNRSCNDGVIELSPLSSHAVLEVVEISHACVVHLVLQYSTTPFSQLDLNPANLEATVEAYMNSGISLLAKTAFLMTSQLRHHYVVSCKY